jgi:hypothetical protein
MERMIGDKGVRFSSGLFFFKSILLKFQLISLIPGRRIDRRYHVLEKFLVVLQQILRLKGGGDLVDSNPCRSSDTLHFRLRKRPGENLLMACWN